MAIHPPAPLFVPREREGTFDAGLFGMALLALGFFAGLMYFLILSATADEIDSSLTVLRVCPIGPGLDTNPRWTEAVSLNVVLWVWIVPAAFGVEWKLRNKEQ